MKKTFYSSLYALLFVTCLQLVHSAAAKAQGCVAIRHMSSCSVGNASSLLQPKHFQFSASYRYFRSHRHFSGTTENKERVELGSEVINLSNSLDLGLTYALTNRLSVSMIVPLSYTDRSSLYEHDRVNRYSSQSYGLGDIRLTANYWLLKPEVYPDQNISIGLGVKLPTGNFNAQDDFFIKPNAPERRPVDQSMQLGDGGVGITLEMQAYKQLFENTSIYVGGFYMLNPRDTNQTRTYRETLRATLSNEKYMSVPDQFMVRAGLAYALPAIKGLSATLGGRIEGVPVRDLIGGSHAFRRPGYVISVEPTLNYMKGPHTFTAGVPVAVVRNRTQSVTDQEAAVARHGDAAFADFVVYFTYAHRF
jgi:hypothetical protein